MNLQSTITLCIYIYLYISSTQERLEELHELWALLMSRLREKGEKLQQALELMQFVRECKEVSFWIKDKVTNSIL